MLNPLRSLEINWYTVAHPKLPSALNGVCVAHITDIHMGRWMRPRHLVPLLQEVNNSQPDLTVLTGDYVGYSARDFDPCTQSLAILKGPVFAILGNHDHWASTQKAMRAFEEVNIPVLRNASTRLSLRPDAPEISLVGIDDAVTKHHDIQRAFEHVPPETFCLTLSHVPELAPHAARAGSHFTLSGHTHGLQFNIPRFSAALASAFRMRYIAGSYVFPEETSALYVSRGLGSASWPWRYRATPELTFFRFKHAPQLHIERTRQTQTRISPHKRPILPSRSA